MFDPSRRTFLAAGLSLGLACATPMVRREAEPSVQPEVEQVEVAETPSALASYKSSLASWWRQCRDGLSHLLTNHWQRVATTAATVLTTVVLAGTGVLIDPVSLAVQSAALV